MKFRIPRTLLAITFMLIGSVVFVPALLLMFFMAWMADLVTENSTPASTALGETADAVGDYFHLLFKPARQGARKCQK